MTTKTNTERIRELLADGRWHGIEEIDEVGGRQSARTRLSELRRAEPGLWERRFRKRRRADGTYAYTARDWRWTGGDWMREADLGAQAARWREHIAAGEVDAHDPCPLRAGGRVVYAPTGGQVALLSDAELAERAFAAYVDPWGGDEA